MLGTLRTQDADRDMLSALLRADEGMGKGQSVQARMQQRHCRLARSRRPIGKEAQVSFPLPGRHSACCISKQETPVGRNRTRDTLENGHCNQFCNEAEEKSRRKAQKQISQGTS